MQSANARPTIPLAQSHKSLVIAVILLILALVGFLTYNAFKAAQVQALPQAATVLSEQMLAEQYGLGVNLIAVTAAGGMVDLRLKIIDGEKAKTLLSDQANFPALLVGDGLLLRADEDIISQTLKFDNGGSIFLLFPNAQSVVKSGDPVTIVFGDLQLEAIQAK
jgi:hypothetical protein